jgi:hypothetical protein
VIRILFDAIQKFIRRHIVLEFQRKKIPPFLVLAEAIGDDDLRDAALVEGVDKRAANESAGTGDKHTGFLVEQDIRRVEPLFTAQA